ncbi:MAG: class I SAM-dependent methyltransferase, partial [Nannocystaceae bacterium]
MTQANHHELTLLPPEVATYVEAHTLPASDLFCRLRDETHRALNLPQMQVGPVEGTFLRLMVQLSRAKSILEVGTYSGYSGLSMAMALPDDGRLVTCDIDPVATAVAKRFFKESGHGHKIDLRLGPALETIAELKAEGASFDLVFLDVQMPQITGLQLSKIISPNTKIIGVEPEGAAAMWEAFKEEKVVSLQKIDT